jgi:enamine deaminase RidA (YjgF/YER057c/UK114 family)
MSVREVGELIGATPGDPETWGLRTDELVYGSGVTGRDRRTREFAPDLPRQADTALATIDEQLAEFGASLANVARIGFYLRDPRDIRLVNDVWTARFPDGHDRPTYKFMRAELDGPHQVRLDFFAVLGEERQCLYLPKVAHGNPIPMAVRMGRYLFTSRVLPYDPVTGEPGRDGADQARLAVLNIGTLLQNSGMTWRDVTQGRAFVADPGDDALVRAHWAGQFGGTAEGLKQPSAQLQITRYRAGALRVLLEIIAAH